jgi:hypothetical protein
VRNRWFLLCRLFGERISYFEYGPLEIPRAIDAHLQKIPPNFILDLKTLPPSDYTSQVMVLDTASQKASVWQAPILVVPLISPTYLEEQNQ